MNNITKEFLIRNNLLILYDNLNQSQTDLKKSLGILTHPKQINHIIIKRLLRQIGKKIETDDYIIKTVQLNCDGYVKEHMSFKPFRFNDIILEDWHYSSIREELSKNIITCIFKYDNSGESHLIDIIVIRLSMCELEMIKEVWQHTKNLVATGNIVKSITSNQSRQTNFFKASKEHIAHVRPHGTNSKNTYPLPVPDSLTGNKEYTKHSFWLNNNFIMNKIEQ